MSSLFPDTASQPSVSIYRISFLQMLATATCFAIGLWGVRVSRTLGGASMAGADSDLNTFLAVACWFILFGPFAALGGYWLCCDVKRLQVVLAPRSRPSHMEFLLPASSN